MASQDNQPKEEMLASGTTLQGGRYRIDCYLSSGGFGNTYLATDTRFEEKVAVKEFFMKGINQREKGNTVSVSNAVNTQKFIEQREKFNKEAQRIRRLNCENIVKVNDLFDENGTSYYVMDYIDGLSLRDIVKQQGPVSESVTLNYLEQTLNALEEVHSKKIFHLDLKPANLMVDKSGRLRVIDFGASKQQKADGSGASASSALCYTPGYAPMEQKDLRFDKFGPWTDIYSLGATMYYVLTGETPPDGTDIQDEREKAFHFPSSVSENMQKLIVWMMEYNRNARPQSVADVRSFLRDGIIPDPSEGPGTIFGPSDPTSSAVVNAQPENSNKLLKGALLALVAIAAFCLIFMLGRKATNGSDTASKAQTEETVTNIVADKACYNENLGDYLYSGPVDDKGLPHGKGTARFTENGIPNGNVYEGPIEHGVFSGDGAVFKYGNINTFEGTFRKNQYAQGKLTINSTGQYFEGTFDDNGKEYNGTWYDKSGQVIVKLKNGK